MTLEEYKESEKYYDKVYRRLDDCDDIHDEVDNKLSNTDKRLIIVEEYLKFFKWATGLIATSSVGTLIAAILNLVLK